MLQFTTVHGTPLEKSFRRLPNQQDPNPYVNAQNHFPPGRKLHIKHPYRRENILGRQQSMNSDSSSCEAARTNMQNRPPFPLHIFSGIPVVAFRTPEAISSLFSQKNGMLLIALEVVYHVRS